MKEDVNDSKKPKKIATKKELTYKNKIVEIIFLFIIMIVASILIMAVIFVPLNWILEMAKDEILDASKNKKVLFKIDNTSFICTESLVEGSKAHIVSYNKGWNIYGEYFKKDDLLFSISNYEVDDITLKN